MDTTESSTDLSPDDILVVPLLCRYFKTVKMSEEQVFVIWFQLGWLKQIHDRVYDAWPFDSFLGSTNSKADCFSIKCILRVIAQLEMSRSFYDVVHGLTGQQLRAKKPCRVRLQQG